MAVAMPRRDRSRTTATTPAPRPASTATTASALPIRPAMRQIVGRESPPRVTANAVSGSCPRCAAEPAGSVSTLAFEHDPDRPPEDPQVVREGPVVDVVQIEPDRFVPGQVGAP